MKKYNAYKNSGTEWIGDVPQHWKVKRLKYLLRLISENSNSELPKIGLENIESWTGNFVETESEFEGEGTRFIPNDILFGKLRPYLAKVFLSNFEGKAVGDFFVFRVKSQISPSFAAKIMLSKTFIDVVSSSTFGSKMPRVSWDFVNDRQTILDAFQPYYETTTVSEETDVNHLYDLKIKLDQFQVYWEREIEGFANVYFHPAAKLNNPKEQKHLYAFTDPAVTRFKAIGEAEKQDEFKKGLRSWTNLYAFLSQIMPFTDSDFEKFYAYAKLLQTRLPKRDLSEAMRLDDEVALEYYRLQKIKEGAIELVKGEVGAISGLTEAGLKRSKEEEASLSEIIHVLNDRFGTDFEEADKLFFDQIETELLEDQTLQTQAKVNPLDTFKYAFEDRFVEKLIERMDQNQEIFEKILEDKAFGNLVKELMMQKVYRRLNVP